MKEHGIHGKKKAAVLLVILLTGSVGTVSFAGLFRAKAPQQESVQTETVLKQDLKKSISVSGTISAAAMYSTNSNITDVRVKELRVKVGDRVKAGDVIALLDTTALERSLSLAKENLSAAQQKNALDLAAAKRNYETAQTTSQIMAARLTGDMQTAQNLYNKSVTDAATAKTENAALTREQQNREKTLSDVQKNADLANAALSQRAKELSAAQNKVDTMKNSISVSDNSATNVDQASYNAAVAALSAAQSTYDAAKADADSKNSALTSAQASLSEVRAKKTESDSNMKNMDSATDANQTAVEKARQSQDDTNRSNAKNLEDTRDLVTGSKTAAVPATISAQQDVDKYQQQIDSCTIKAPADGLVTSVSVRAGDTYKGGEIAMIQDDTGYKVSATVDQYDISDVTAGQAAVIKTETTGDQDMTGKLTFVSPVPRAATAAATTTAADAAATVTATSNAGGDYPVEASIDHPSERLRIGMTAKLTIVEKEVRNALTVSDSSVRTDAAGNHFVEVQKDDGSAGKIPVTYGLKTDYYVQIIGKGLREGMKVIQPQDEATNMSETAAGTSAAVLLP